MFIFKCSWMSLEWNRWKSFQEGELCGFSVTGQAAFLLSYEFQEGKKNGAW